MYLVTTRHLTYQQTLTLPTPTYQYGNKTPLKEQWPELSRGDKKGRPEKGQKDEQPARNQKKKKGESWSLLW